MKKQPTQEHYAKMRKLQLTLHTLRDQLSEIQDVADNDDTDLDTAVGLLISADRAINRWLPVNKRYGGPEHAQDIFSAMMSVIKSRSK